MARNLTSRKGIPRSPEVKAKISASKLGHTVSLETRQKISASLQVIGRHTDERGYIFLTGQHGHPLASSTGRLKEHRKVLYDAIGPGEHLCHWCGLLVRWEDGTLQPDHVDWDRSNNVVTNLVASCSPCNSARKKPKERHGTAH